MQVTALPQSLPDTGFFDQPKGVGLLITALFIVGFVALAGAGAWRRQSER